jgi:hypothetical protein
MRGMQILDPLTFVPPFAWHQIGESLNWLQAGGVRKP